MTDQQMPAAGNASGILHRSGLARNLLAASLLIGLSLANYHFHVRFPTQIGWLPAGLAMALVLIHGPGILPGIFIGSSLWLLLTLAEPLPTLAFAAGNTLVCLAAWYLLVKRVAQDPLKLSVRSMARILIVGATLHVLLAVVLGPVAISHQIRHANGAATSPAAAHMPHGRETAASGPEAAHGTANANPHAIAPASPHTSPPTPAPASAPAATHAMPMTVHGTPAMAASSADGGAMSAHPAAHDLFEWLLTEPIGILLVVPLVLYARMWRREIPDAGPRGTMPWIGLASLLGVTAAIYSGFIERSFGVVHTTLLVLPPAVWLALEYELAFTLFGNFAVIVLVGIGTALGYGPFKDHTSGLALLTAVYTLTTLMIAASSVERRQASARIFQLATRDSLTGLINRSAFLERVEQALSSARRYGHRMAILFIDLDNFKTVNDTLGHQAGDQLLIEASQRILACLRRDSTLARLGGDEMVALVERAESDLALAIVAGRITDSLADPFPIMGTDCRISCSIGMSRFPDDGDTVSDLLMKADIAMYEVKTTGRNGFRTYSPGMHNYLDTDRRLPPVAVVAAPHSTGEPPA